MRPPVVLIHGVWSDPSAWDFFDPLSCKVPTQTCPDLRFQVFKIDYQATNAAGFRLNASRTLPQLITFLSTFKVQNDMAAVQFDIVAHSMGGNIVQSWVLLPNFLRDNNYRQGDVHKLITLDTPFLGSQFANNLLQSTKACRKIFDKLGLSTNQGAITDLAVGSAMLSALQIPAFPLRAHVFAGIANRLQTLAAEGNLGTLVVQTACPNVLPLGGFPVLFGQNNDLIVSEDSQSAKGLFFDSPGSPLPSGAASIFQVSAIHTSIPLVFDLGPDVLSRNAQGIIVVGAQTQFPALVLDQLNQPINSGSFARILP